MSATGTLIVVAIARTVCTTTMPRRSASRSTAITTTCESAPGTAANSAVCALQPCTFMR
jgi:hypothetical protein